MKGGRARLGGEVAVAWSEVALARPHQRRTLRLRTAPPDGETQRETAHPQTLAPARSDAPSLSSGRHGDGDGGAEKDEGGRVKETTTEEKAETAEKAGGRRTVTAMDARAAKEQNEPNESATLAAVAGRQRAKGRTGGVHFHIRELNMLAGGLGCALWDGAVVLARWIAANPHVFVGQTVMELGAGCGLPGIVAARVASRVVLTEYIPELVRNLEYNIGINSKDADSGSDEDDDDRDDTSVYPVWHRDLRPIASAAFLDWLQVPDPRAPPDGGAALAAAAATAAAAAARPACSRAIHGRGYRVQVWNACLDCFPTLPDNGVCDACAAACHAGHRLGPRQESRFRCDCGDGGGGACQISDAPPPRSELLVPAASGAALAQVDILLGAEITYNTLSIEALANVVDTYLKPDGVFYETLSNDRDGVDAFVDEMARRGFAVARCAADRGYLGNYNTRDWSFQNVESYTFYTFSRPASTHPIMDSRTPSPRLDAPIQPSMQ